MSSIHPECRFHLEIQEEETRCAELLRTQTEKHKGKAVRCLVRLSPGWTGRLASSLHLTQKTGVYSHLCLFKKKKSVSTVFLMNCWQKSYSIAGNGQWGMCVGKGRGEGGPSRKPFNVIVSAV